MLKPLCSRGFSIILAFLKSGKGAKFGLLTTNTQVKFVSVAAQHRVCGFGNYLPFCPRLPFHLNILSIAFAATVASAKSIYSKF